MGVITVKLSDYVEKLLREETFRRFGGKRGGISRIVEEALLAWLQRKKESVRLYRVVKDGRVMFESRDLDQIAEFLKKNNLSLRDVQVVIIPTKDKYRLGPRGLR